MRDGGMRRVLRSFGAEDGTRGSWTISRVGSSGGLDDRTYANRSIDRQAAVEAVDVRLADVCRRQRLDARRGRMDVTRLFAGDRNVGSAITIVLALAGVNALLTVYFYACAKRAEAIERARPGPVPDGVVET
jgi:hypothetical protein